MAPARLVSRDVTGLRMNIDWARGREGRVIVHPPLIHVVDRRPSEIGTGEPYWAWVIQFGLSAEGEISFGAAGFREEVVAKPVVLLDRWYFSVSERVRLLGA